MSSNLKWKNLRNYMSLLALMRKIFQKKNVQFLKTSTSTIDTIDSYDQLHLSHSSPDCLSLHTADELISNYVDVIKIHLNENPSIKQLDLYGHSMGGAILTKVLERIQLNGNEAPFQQLESYNIVIDRTFSSLTKVTTTTDGSFGMLPIAVPLMWLLGWQINPKDTINNILKRPQADTTIYISTSLTDGQLGSAKLSRDGINSPDNGKGVSIKYRITARGHNDEDGVAKFLNGYRSPNNQPSHPLATDPLMAKQMQSDSPQRNKTLRRRGSMAHLANENRPQGPK
ncbi:hypothetical protein N9C31_03855 [Gammaproteobacteria bacterium]|nr:hypothetical protein [Gammaproteobacteria bacterium]